MPTNDEIFRIEHLRNYVADLNRGRGMGFVVSRKRISFSFVLSVTIKVASTMGVVFPIMLSLTRVELQEDGMLGEEGGGNSTRQDGCVWVC